MAKHCFFLIFGLLFACNVDGQTELNIATWNIENLDLDKIKGNIYNRETSYDNNGNRVIKYSKSGRVENKDTLFTLNVIDSFLRQNNIHILLIQEGGLENKAINKRFNNYFEDKGYGIVVTKINSNSNNTHHTNGESYIALFKKQNLITVGSNFLINKITRPPQDLYFENFIVSENQKFVKLQLYNYHALLISDLDVVKESGQLRSRKVVQMENFKTLFDKLNTLPQQHNIFLLGDFNSFVIESARKKYFALEQSPHHINISSFNHACKSNDVEKIDHIYTRLSNAYNNFQQTADIKTVSNLNSNLPSNKKFGDDSFYEKVKNGKEGYPKRFSDHDPRIISMKGHGTIFQNGRRILENFNALEQNKPIDVMACGQTLELIGSKYPKTDKPITMSVNIVMYNKETLEVDSTSIVRLDNTTVEKEAFIMKINTQFLKAYLENHELNGEYSAFGLEFVYGPFILYKEIIHGREESKRQVSLFKKDGTQIQISNKNNDKIYTYLIENGETQYTMILNNYPINSKIKINFGNNEEYYTTDKNGSLTISLADYFNKETGLVFNLQSQNKDEIRIALVYNRITNNYNAFNQNKVIFRPSDELKPSNWTDSPNLDVLKKLAEQLETHNRWHRLLEVSNHHKIEGLSLNKLSKDFVIIYLENIIHSNGISLFDGFIPFENNSMSNILFSNKLVSNSIGISTSLNKDYVSIIGEIDSIKLYIDALMKDSPYLYCLNLKDKSGVLLFSDNLANDNLLNTTIENINGLSLLQNSKFRKKFYENKNALELHKGEFYLNGDVLFVNDLNNMLSLYKINDNNTLSHINSCLFPKIPHIDHGGCNMSFYNGFWFSEEKEPKVNERVTLLNDDLMLFSCRLFSTIHQKTCKECCSNFKHTISFKSLIERNRWDKL